MDPNNIYPLLKGFTHHTYSSNASAYWGGGLFSEVSGSHVKGLARQSHHRNHGFEYACSPNPTTMSTVSTTPKTNTRYATNEHVPLAYRWIQTDILIVLHFRSPTGQFYSSKKTESPYRGMRFRVLTRMFPPQKRCEVRPQFWVRAQGQGQGRVRAEAFVRRRGLGLKP